MIEVPISIGFLLKYKALLALGVLMSGEGHWLSIAEYSNFKDISVSTVRRYIKANRVKYKKESGKYLIFVAREKLEPQNLDQQKENLQLKLEIDYLKQKVLKLEEENNDLKMLVSIYEDAKKSPQKDKASKNESPPDIPFS